MKLNGIQTFRLFNEITSNPLKTAYRQIYQNRCNLNVFNKWYQQSIFVPQRTKPPFKHIVQVGDPVLRQRASAVPKEQITSNEIQSIIKDLIDVMHGYNAIGVAAPQIGVSLQIIVMEFTEKFRQKFSPQVYKAKQMETLPLTILINPSIVVKNYNIRTFSESCESVRGYYADVPRYEEVFVRAFNSKAETVEMHLKGWNSRVVQHEIDHLNGQIYTDIMDRKTLSCGCWEAVNRHGGRVEIRFCP